MVVGAAVDAVGAAVDVVGAAVDAVGVKVGLAEATDVVGEEVLTPHRGVSRYDMRPAPA